MRGAGGDCEGEGEAVPVQHPTRGEREVVCAEGVSLCVRCVVYACGMECLFKKQEREGHRRENRTPSRLRMKAGEGGDSYSDVIARAGTLLADSQWSDWGVFLL